MTARQNNHERHLIAAGAVGLALYNGLLAMFRAPFDGFGQMRHVISPELMRGSHFLLVLTAVTLLLIAPGLWHGKRFAWLLALGCAVVSVLAHPLRNVDLWGTVDSAVFVGLLVGARPQFPARSDTPTMRRGLITLAIGLAAIFLYSIVGLYVLDDEFFEGVSLKLAVLDALRLMFVVPSLVSEPQSRHAATFIDSIRLSIVFVWLVGALQLLQPVLHRHRTAPAERHHVRTLLDRYGDSTLAFFALLPDKTYFRSESGNAVLAYAVAGDTAIVMGDPLGERSEFKDLIEGFLQHCEMNGWSYAFSQARPEFLPLYTSLGLKALKAGEEGIVNLAEFSLSGQANKHLRATMNRFAREGYRVEIVSPPHPAARLERLQQISDDWLAQGQRRERGFTLGYFDAGLLQQTDVMLVLDAAGAPVAFANIVPWYRSSIGNFDMVRYGRYPKDVADFVYVSLIEHFRTQGLTGMTVGLAPFSGLADQEPASPAAIAMRLLYRYGTAILRYRGLREFKEKFASTWEPRYLIYRDETQLPGIALAITRVGERPHASSREITEGFDADPPHTSRPAIALATTAALALPRLVRRFPATSVVLLVYLVIGAATATFLRDQHAALRSYVGWDVDALRNGQYWRQLPNTLIQTSPGLKWHQPLLLIAFLAFLEERAGSLTAAFTFFVADWIISPSTVLIVWALSLSGYAPATAVLHSPSTGASAATLACGAAGAMLLPARLRYAFLAVFVVGVAGSAMTQQFDTLIAHMLACAVGVALGSLWAHRGAEVSRASSVAASASAS